MYKKDLTKHIEESWQGPEKNYYVVISLYCDTEGYDDNFRAINPEDLNKQLVEWLKLHGWCVEDLWNIEIKATEKEVEVEF